MLAPEARPAAIQRHVHPRSAGAAGRAGSAEKAESDLVAILALMKSQLPLDFSDYKRATLFRRVRKRMTHHRLTHSNEYLALLRNNPLELEALAQDFLISVTAFFREQPAFQLLEREVIPTFLDKPGSQEVKVWVAGCATGVVFGSDQITCSDQIN